MPIDVLKVVVLLSLALATVSEAKECKSCEWVSEAGTEALFALENNLDSTIETGDNSEIKEVLRDAQAGNLMFEGLSNFKNQANLINMMDSLLQIGETEFCDETIVGKLIALEARLEEGDQNGETKPYQTRKLTKFLEINHLRLLEICKEKAKAAVETLRFDPVVMSSWITFAKFGEFLKERITAIKKSNSVWFSGLISAGHDLLESKEDFSSEADRETDLVRTGKQILQREYLFEKIKHESLGKYFASEGDESQDCKVAVAENLVKKHSETAQKLRAVFQPLVMLANYNPSDYVEVPKSAKRGRPIFKVNDSFNKDFLKNNKNVVSMMELSSFIRHSTKRASELCQ